MDTPETLRRFLSNNGGMAEIYDAIASYDMAKVVKAATNSLKNQKYFKQDNILRDHKCKAESEKLRNSGNAHYKEGRHKQALIDYNIALAYAPKNSVEMMLAYGNRSAVMFSIRHFTACQTDINTCLSMDCPEQLFKKLIRRKNDTLLYINEQLEFELSTNTLFICSFFQFDCKRNAEVPCASADVAFESRDGVKFITAGNAIRAGTVVAIERAFATATTDNPYLNCYYCHRLILGPYPCEGCCKAFFCDDECRDLCMKEYHRIECHIMGYIHGFGDLPFQLMIRSAIKLSLKLGWERLVMESKNIGASRLKTATTSQAYNVQDPLSMLCYDDNKKFLEGKMFNGSIVCAVILHHLDKVPNYFPKEITKREEAKEALSRIMLHLYTHFTNTITLTCATYNMKSKSMQFNAQNNCGWFSMSSKLKHSCQPNLMTVGLNASLALVALRPIKKGEELTISFIEHFYEYRKPPNVPNYRRTQLYLRTLKTCACQVCDEDWDILTELSTDDQTESLINTQYSIMTLLKNNYELRAFKEICDVFTVFSLKSAQYKFCYATLRAMLSTIQCKITNNKSYN